MQISRVPCVLLTSVLTVAVFMNLYSGCSAAAVVKREARSSCLDGTYMSAEKRCVEQCVPGKFGDDRTGFCQPCADSCKTCKTSSSSCTSCNEPYYLLGDECVSECGTQYERGPVRTRLRLVDGASNFEGRVEILHEGQWGTVCDDGWNLQSANVVCRELQLGDALEAVSAVEAGFNATNVPPLIHMDDVQCTGLESKLDFCKHAGWEQHNCGHFEDAGVRCSGPDMARLCVSNCGTGFYLDTQLNTCKLCNEKCRECSDAADQCVSCEAPRFLNEGDCVINCGVGLFGNINTKTCDQCDASCWNCVDGDRSNVCSSCHEDRYLQDSVCVESCNDGLKTKNVGIRLMDGSTIYEGRVEVYVNGEWGTVCDDTWDIHDAEVVCRELGYGRALNAIQTPGFGPGSGPVLIDRIRCNGSEAELIHCPQAPFGENVCLHYEDAGVACSGSKSLGATGKCVEDCGIGYFLVGSECKTCNAECRSCDGTADHCTECKASKYLLDSTCVSDCGDHKFGDTRTGQCEECDNGCRDCADGEVNNNCTSCYRGNFLMGSVCSIMCLPGTFQLYGECVSDCGFGRFGNGMTSNCEACEGDCRTCEVTSAMLQCTSCYPPKVLDNGRCVAQCSSGLYAVNMDLSGIMGNMQMRLAGGRNHLEGRVEVLYDGEWGTVCEDFFRKNAAMMVCSEMGFGSADSFFIVGSETGISPGDGQIWLDNVLCFGFEGRIAQCSHHPWGEHNCNHDKDIAVRCSGPGIRQCVVDCPTGHFQDTTDNTCKLCHEGCLTCTGYPSYSCTQCQEGTHLKELECVDDCGNGYHSDASSVCQPCSLSCSTCQGSPTRCTSCTLPLYLNGETCVAECPELTLLPTQKVRLVGGNSEVEGRLELFYEGSWGTVCDDQWSLEDANVVCVELGYGHAVEAKIEAAFGEGSGDILLDNIDCVGNESSIIYCNHDGLGVNDCDHMEDAGVICSGPTTSNICMTRAECTGQFFLTADRQTCSKCDVSCSECADSATTCLRCKEGYFLTSENKCELNCPNHHYSDSENICRPCGDSCLECSGNPDQCTRCQAPNKLEVSTKSCVPSCTSGFVSRFRGDVRLRGSINSLEGRVELFHKGQWGTVCDDSWNIDDAHVVCRQLGFGSAVEAVIRGAYGEGEGPIWLDEMECIGTEKHIRDCRRDTSDLGDHDCQHSEDAGVRCSGPDSSLQCVEDCGVGYFPDLNHVCQECSLDCLGCAGASDHCTSCASPKFLKDGQCMDTCGTGFFGNTQIRQCQACDGNCAECYDGRTAQLCKSCKSAYILEGLDCVSECQSPSLPVSEIIETHGTSSSRVRLFGGRNEFEGIVQVLHNGVWGGICNTNWDMADAEVVCRELGFGTPITIIPAGEFAAVPADVPIHLDRVQCRRFESYLAQCQSDGWGTYQCDPNHLQDAAIRCRAPSNNAQNPQQENICRRTNDDICQKQTCFPGVVCRNVGSERSVCMDCPAGQFGDGKHCTVVATELPIFKEDYTPMNKTVIAGYPHTFYCHGEGDPAPGVTADSWQKDGLPLDPEDLKSGRIGVFEYGSLYFKQTRRVDKGIYTCTLKNSQGSRSRSAELVVEEPPKILRTESGEGVLNGKVDLGCYAVGYPIPVITWERDGVPLTESRYVVKNGHHTLEINELSRDDEGEYTCHAKNKLGNYYATVLLTVNEPPTFTKEPITVEIEEDSTAKMQCEVTGRPLPKVVWKKNGETVSFSDNRYFLDGTSLTIFHVEREDMGNYACIAISPVQTISRFAQLLVIGPPHIMEGPVNDTYIVGETVTLTCDVIGSPNPVVSWEINGEKLTDARNIQIGEDFLKLIDVRPEDTGEYSCVAKNAKGTVRQTAYISVNGPLHYGSPRKVGLVAIIIPSIFLLIAIAIAVLFFCRKQGKLSGKLDLMPGVKKGKQGLTFTPIYTGKAGNSYVKFDKPEREQSPKKNSAQRDSMTESILKSQEEDYEDGQL